MLVTSRNAIGSLPDWARDRPVFAVGDATAARVRSAGFQDVRSASGDAAALVELVCRMMPQSAPLLLLTGKGQGEALAGRLRAASRPVNRREVYEAVAVAALPGAARDALTAGTLRAALFFSARSARCFIRLAASADLHETIRDTDACAIGPPIVVALQQLPWRRIRIAAHPTHDEMLALLR